MRFLGVDTGGTFTDCVEVSPSGEIRMDKAFSTKEAPEEAILSVLEQMAASEQVTLGEYLSGIAAFSHGTTVSTNALIQRRGSRVGLLVTRGFEDVLEIARGPVGRVGGLPQSLAMDFLHTEPKAPIVQRTLVRGVDERIDADGSVVRAAAPDDIEEQVLSLIKAGAESIAVCLLWSFKNPTHELLIKHVVGQVAPDIPLCLSSEIAPRLGEFERTVTTSVNAFIGPITKQYIGSLAHSLSSLGYQQRLYIMKASGGVTTPDRVFDEAVSVINSGPVGGIIASRYLGQELGETKLITADMGGTSFDVGLVIDGRFEEQTSPFLDQGLPISTSSVKIVTIGAGGGSIATTDGYRLRVGPQSAGSDPGPVCYGRGNLDPTVTDALVVMGFIDPQTFFGGRYQLNRELAAQSILERIGEPLGLDLYQAAAGIYQIVTSSMADLIRKITVEAGFDVRTFSLCCYGGATGLHCGEFAKDLGVQKIIIPYAAPVFSAYGVAIADTVYTATQSMPSLIEPTEPFVDSFNHCVEALLEKCAHALGEDFFDRSNVTFYFKLDVRYVGQMNEVALTWPGKITAQDIPRIVTLFEDAYRSRFGVTAVRGKNPLELINIRLEASEPKFKSSLMPLPAPAEQWAHHSTTRQIYHPKYRWIQVDVYDFSTIAPHEDIIGPAIVQRDATTIWVPKDCSVERDQFGNLIMRLQGESCDD
jgi:N-methylhydantoinase A